MISKRRQSRWCHKSARCWGGLVPSRGRISCACQARARPASPCSTARKRATPLPTPCPANGGAWRPSCARAAAMQGRPILTAEAMRCAEQAVVDAGTSVEQLMERAGAALAEAVYRVAGPREPLVVCGPGNDGGDGYVAAPIPAERDVRVQL